ncbi:threonine synthase, partial [Coemansia linderi]
MNKIAFGLLRAGLDASDSLSLLQCLLDGGILPAGMFKSPMAVVQTDQLVLEELVERRLPQLSAHLRVKLGGAAPLAPATVSWFLTLFVDCLPEPHRLRVWDMLFVRGYPAVFQACLAILELNQPALLLCATPVAVYALLQNVRAVMEHVDVDDFGALAFGQPRSFSVSASEIGLLRQQVSLTMKYRSTRGQVTGQSFESVVLEGLAADGGLYIPEHLPSLPTDWQTQWADLSFAELATELITLFVGDDLSRDQVSTLVSKSYSTFSTPEVTPLVDLDREKKVHILELFHGPTFAFKDVALQFLGNLFEFFLERRNSSGGAHKITVVGATSGDTGSAAIYGLRGKKNVEVFILHPEGR